MNARSSRATMFAGVVLSCVWVVGCGPKSAPTSQAAPQTTASDTTQTPEQRQQAQARVAETIRTMTPEQRAAHFKAHPEDAAAVSRMPSR